MKKILISGNGIFLDKNKSLSNEGINFRFIQYFKIYSDYVLGTKYMRYRKLSSDISNFNVLSIGDGFYSLIDSFYSDFINYSKTDNYEKLFGQTVDKLLMYVNLKSKYYDLEKINKFFGVVYGKMVNIIQAVIFMDLPTKRSSNMLNQLEFKGYTHYTLNILKDDAFEYYLHGQYDLKKWTNDIDSELMAAGGYENEGDLVLFAENIGNDPLDFEIPMLFGRDIIQKENVLRILKGYNETNNKKIFEAIKRKIPYKRLKNESVGNEVHILGVNVSSHLELINILNKANKIYWYWFSKDDLDGLLKIKNHKVIVRKYNEFK